MFDLSDIITKSLRLAWKHKLLWVFSVLLLGAGSYNSSGGGGNSKEESSNNKVTKVERTYKSDYENSKDVLGAYTQKASELGLIAQPDDKNNYIGTPDKRVMMPPVGEDMPTPTPGAPFPPDFEPSDTRSPYNGLALITPFIPSIVIVGVALFIFMIFSIAIGMFIKSWALGSYYTGIDMAIKDQNYTLESLGSAGRVSTKAVFRYSLITSLPIFLTIGLGLVSGFFYVITQNPLFLALLFLPILLMLFIILILAAVNNFSTRFVVFKQYSIKGSIKAAFKVIFSNFGHYFLLGVSNCFIQALLGGVAIGLIVAIALGVVVPLGFASNSFESFFNSARFILLATLIGVPMFIALIAAISAVKAFLKTYNQFTWSFFYNLAHDKEGYVIPSAAPRMPNTNQTNTVPDRANTFENRNSQMATPSANQKPNDVNLIGDAK